MITEELRAKWKKQLKKDTASKLKSLVTEVIIFDRLFCYVFSSDFKQLGCLRLAGIVVPGFEMGNFFPDLICCFGWPVLSYVENRVKSLP